MAAAATAATATVNVALALTLMPVSLCLGFTAATISFTAWNIVVPLLLNGFGLPLAPTVFISVMLDVCNCAVLTVVYGWHGKVDWRLGLTFGAVSATAAAIVSNVMVDFLEEHQDYLKGVMYVVPFVLSVGFIAKGGIVLRRRRQQAASGAPPPSQELEPLDGDSEAAFAADGSELPGGEQEEDDHNHANSSTQGWRPAGTTPSEPMAHGADGTPSRLGALRPSALELGSASYAASATALPDGGPPASAARPGGPVRTGSASMFRSLESLTPKFARTGARGQGYERLLADGSATNDDLHDDGEGHGGGESHSDPAGADPPITTTTMTMTTSAMLAAPTSPVEKGPPHVALSATAAAGALARTTSSGTTTSAVRRTSVVSLLHEATTVITVPPLERQHVPVWTIKPRPPQLSPTTTTSWRDWWRTHFQPDDELLKRRLSKRSLRLSLMGLFSAIMGSLSGALYVGGGMGFALAIASFFRANVRLATGTGCFVCFLTMLALSFAFVRDTEELLPAPTAAYFFASVPMGVLGAVAGVRLSLRISDTLIFFFIGGVLAIIGVVLVVQSTLQS